MIQFSVGGGWLLVLCMLGVEPPRGRYVWKSEFGHRYVVPPPTPQPAPDGVCMQSWLFVGSSLCNIMLCALKLVPNSFCYDL